MKVLLVHNRYRTSAPSGEDIAVRNEQRMLEKRGVEVTTFDRCNDDIDDSTPLARAAAAANTIWSRRSRSDLRSLLDRIRPDVVHVHNTFSVLSPSIYGVCRAAAVPVVQTLHNFRFFCPGALFLREGRPCEDCVDRSLLQAVRHRCYRNSIAATATLAAMLQLHRTIGTYTGGIDRYVALTQFARAKMLKGGILERKLSVKPNFLPDPPAAGGGGGGYAIFVGRLLEGKGADTLLQAWRLLPGVRLKIVGDGALRPRLEAIARRDGLNVEFTGRLERSAVLEAVSRAELMVVPSTWYEGFPMVVAESFACGTPVVASRIGSLAELVQNGVTGRHFTPGDAPALALAVQHLLADGGGLRRMRHASRAYFEAHLTEDRNYEQLMSIYREAVGRDSANPGWDGRARSSDGNTAG